MRPLLVAGACALAVVTILPCLESSGAATPPVAECVEYHEVSHPESRTYDLRLANGCTRIRACTASWTVTCGKSSHAEHASAVLAVSEEKGWVASAQDCEDDWSIDARWRCAPAR